MALVPSAESGKVREQVLEIVNDHPDGITPAETYRIMYGKDPNPDSMEDKAAKQRVYYWMKALHKTKTFTQRGTSRGSTYFPAGKDRPIVRDLPGKRQYTRHAITARAGTTSPPAANGEANDNTQLISFIVDDISEKLDRLKGLLR